MKVTQIVLGPLALEFHRTCRVPEKSALGTANKLPAGLGRFPLFRAGDLKDRPEEFHPESYLLPIWPQEALWVSLRASEPVAISVGAGKVNAVTGKTLEPRLYNDAQNPQSYLVAPPQPWIDGFKTEDGTVRQFVAVRLGSGETVEGQVTGTEEFGGLQFGVHMSKVDLITVSPPHLVGGGWDECLFDGPPVGGGVVMRAFSARTVPQQMGLGAGGTIEQKLYPDPYVEHTGKSPQEIWFDDPAHKAFVHLVAANDWKALTGQEPPPSPITFQTYQEHGIPWFDLSDKNYGDVAGSPILAGVKPVSGAPSARFKEKAGAEPDPTTKDVW